MLYLVLLINVETILGTFCAELVFGYIQQQCISQRQTDSMQHACHLESLWIAE